MDDPRLKYVTERYPQLQGLVLMPLSVLFLASAAYRAGWYSLPGDEGPHVADRWFFGGIGLAIAASYPITAWYRRRLGTAPQGIAHSQLWPILAGIAALAIGIALQPFVPFSAPVAMVALVIGAFGIRDYPFRSHYLAAAAVLLAFSLLRALGIPKDVLSVLFDATIAVALAIGGIGDHRLLVSTLEPVQAYV